MAREIKKILVIKLSALGDFVLALAAMKKIREAHKKAHITLLTTPPFEALAKSCPYFNAVEVDGKPESFGGWMELRGRIKIAAFRSGVTVADMLRDLLAREFPTTEGDPS